MVLHAFVDKHRRACFDFSCVLLEEGGVTWKNKGASDSEDTFRISFTM